MTATGQASRRVLGFVVWWLACAVGLFATSAARADTVASLLGSFTINQYCELRLDPGEVGVRFVVVFGQLPALRELHAADADGDGVTTQAERDAHVARLAPDFARRLSVSIDGTPVPLTAVRWTSSLPAEQSGFSLRLDIDYVGRPESLANGGTATVAFDNANYAGQIGWHEIVVRSAPAIRAFDTDAFDESLTNGLAEALQALPADGPLDERTVHLRYATGALPAGAVPIGGRTTKAPVTQATPAPTDAPAGEWLPHQTKRLVDLIAAPVVSTPVMLLALLAAMVLGALHAFSPGHGKTIVGAYLIGSRSTPRHAIFLGLTVTVTHTLVVFAVGLATLIASRYVVPERLFPLLSLLSGLLVLGMGLVLLRQRWATAHMAFARQLLRWFEKRSAIPNAGLDRSTKGFRAIRPLPPAGHHGMRRNPPPHDHGPSGHSHHDGGLHGHDHAHADGMHSHGGGRMHSHLPPGAMGEPVGWRSLLALGVSGGLVPCPSAMVLLLAAVALNKTFYGLLMVVAFSIGLALTLIAVGMAFLYARSRFSGRLRGSGIADMLPAVSGAFITIVGLVLCYGALTSGALRSLRA